MQATKLRPEVKGHTSAMSYWPRQVTDSKGRKRQMLPLGGKNSVHAQELKALLPSLLAIFVNNPSHLL